jgi:antitoxin (DNA-binding transcriptional repressor) of toxin-antitoxin stability system
MLQFDISEAEVKIAQLFQSALNGEEIIITRDNQPILKLSQLSSSPKKRQRGSAKGQIWMSPDFDEPLEDMMEYME